jgi:hypothetical protein
MGKKDKQLFKEYLNLYSYDDEYQQPMSYKEFRANERKKKKLFNKSVNNYRNQLKSKKKKDVTREWLKVDDSRKNDNKNQSVISNILSYFF